MQLAAVRQHDEALHSVTDALVLGEPATPLIWRFLTAEHRALGHWQETLASGRMCVRTTSQEPRNYPYRQDILRECDTAIRDALQHDSRVEVHVTSPPEGTRVTIGQELTPALAALGRPVGAGTVVVEVSAPGHTTHRQNVEVATDQTVPVSLRLEREVPGERPEGGEVTPCPECPREVSRGPGAWPWVLFGSGVLAGIGGGVSLWYSFDQRNEFEGYCPSYRCETEMQYNSYRPLLQDASLFQSMAIGALTYAVCSIAGGLIWNFTARPTARPSVRSSSAMWLAPTSTGAVLNVGGRF